MKLYRFAVQKRFIVSGLLNTFVGSVAIFFFQFWLAKPLLANILGYLLGGFIGYWMHTLFTFRSRVSGLNFFYYWLIWLTGVSLNLLILKFLLYFLNPYLSQFIAICSFPIYSFLMQSRFAFPAAKRLP
jgi:putative flippase GtrA